MLDKRNITAIRSKIRRILVEEWNPVGIKEIPEAADEYDSYIGGVFELLELNASAHELAEYLRRIEVERMELINTFGEPLIPEEWRNKTVHSLIRLRHHFR